MTNLIRLQTHSDESRPRRFVISLAIPLGLGLFAGCSNQDDNSEVSAPEDQVTSPPTSESPSADTDRLRSITSELQIDATAGGVDASPTDEKNKFTYFNLDSNQEVALTDAAAALSTDWHIAFKRDSIKLNGGASGPGNVNGAVAVAQEDFYDASGAPNASVFLATTQSSEKPSFDAVTDVSALSYQADRFIPAIRGDGSEESWWVYDSAASIASAQPTNWWLVRSSSGDSYAKLHATDLTTTATGAAITVEFLVQQAGQSAFSSSALTHTFDIKQNGSAECYDFDAGAQSDCTDPAWDIKAQYDTSARLYHLWTNGGISAVDDGKGGAFGKIAQTDINKYVVGTHEPGGGDIDMLYVRDKTGGVFVDQPWYAYSLQDDHKLYPNFRVYAIDTGAAQYKLQLLSYYDVGGTSGILNVRHAPVAATTATVNVILNEWSVKLDAPSAPTGRVKFHVKNEGPNDIHEFVVIKTDLPPEDLPVNGVGAVNELGADIEVVGEIEDIPVGSKEYIAAFDLAPGKYVLICNIYDPSENEAHYHEGMRAAFTVSEN